MVRARDKSPESFGWQKIELKPNPKAVLYPLSWGILPISFSVIMAFTGKGEQWIEWLGGFGILLFLVGGVAAIGPRQGSFNSMKVALGFFFCVLALFSWILVATDNLMYIYGIFSSLLALIMMYRSMDFIFKDLGLKLRNRVIWHFGHGLHAKNRFSGRYETLLWFTKSDDYTFNLDPVRVPSKYPGKRHYKGDKKGKPSGEGLNIILNKINVEKKQFLYVGDTEYDVKCAQNADVNFILAGWGYGNTSENIRKIDNVNDFIEFINKNS